MKLWTEGDVKMISIVEKPENVEVKVSANIEDTTDIILVNLQIALECLIEAKNLVIELNGESIMTDVLDDCIEKINLIISTNPKVRKAVDCNDKNN